MSPPHRLQLALARASRAALLVVASITSAWGNDRPYEATWTAVAEDDDDAVWSIESWATRLGSARTVSVAPEYAFSPTTTMQLELARAHDRGSDQWASSAELEFKHLFSHIRRDGYGWGTVLTLAAAKLGADRWKRDEWSVKLPLSVPLWEARGLLHLNASFGRQRDERPRWDPSVAVEGEVWRRTRLFAELARADRTQLLHAGVRHWLKRERLAIDLSMLRVRGDGRVRHGAIIGLGWYDL